MINLFAVKVPQIAASFLTRLNDNFQVLNPAF
jgi:hypothetical protein